MGMHKRVGWEDWLRHQSLLQAHVGGLDGFPTQV